MGEIPEDVMRAAEAEIAKGDMAFITVARAILAERKRCAEWCDLYLFPQEIKEAIIGGDKP